MTRLFRSRRAPSAGPRGGRLELLAGVLTAVVVLLAGVLFAVLSPPQYRATSTLVVLPASVTAQTPAYYDTLSQGQVSQTFAQVLQLGAAQTTKSAHGTATATVTAVPNTSLITVNATAATAATAEATADAVVDQAQPYVSQLRSPYELLTVRNAAGTAERSGVSLTVLAIVIPLVALMAGFGAHQAVRVLRGPTGLAYGPSDAGNAGPAVAGGAAPDRPGGRAPDGKRVPTTLPATPAVRSAPSSRR